LSSLQTNVLFIWMGKIEDFHCANLSQAFVQAMYGIDCEKELLGNFEVQHQNEWAGVIPFLEKIWTRVKCYLPLNITIMFVHVQFL